MARTGGTDAWLRAQILSALGQCVIPASLFLAIRCGGGFAWSDFVEKSENLLAWRSPYSCRSLLLHVRLWGQFLKRLWRNKKRFFSLSKNFTKSGEASWRFLWFLASTDLRLIFLVICQVLFELRVHICWIINRHIGLTVDWGSRQLRKVKLEAEVFLLCAQ